MAHRLYHAEAFIIASRPSGETSRAYWLLTDNLGLVIAEARAVREIKSKLRYHLTVGSLVRVSLVRGRERWRLAGAETEKALPAAGRRSWASVMELIRTTFATEHPEPVVFAELKNAFGWLTKENINQKSVDTFRLVVMVRILHLLGFIGGERLEKILELDWASPGDLSTVPPAVLKDGLKEVLRALAMI